MAKLPVYNIEFHGYKLDKDVEKLPTYSGIYMIYRCIYNAATDRVTLKELFYIGKATNLHDEVNYHKYRKEFLKQAQPGEEICYAYAEVIDMGRQLCPDDREYYNETLENRQLANLLRS